MPGSEARNYRRKWNDRQMQNVIMKFKSKAEKALAPL